MTVQNMSLWQQGNHCKISWSPKCYKIKVTVHINSNCGIQNLHSAQTKCILSTIHRCILSILLDESLQVNVNVTFWQNYTFTQSSPTWPTYSHKEFKPNWKWKCLKMQNITWKYFFTALWTHTCISVKVKQRRQGNFSRVTSLVLAVGSVLTFNPSWVTGVCWCAEEGQEGTLLPRPLRSHVGNSWAVPDSRVRGNVAGSTGLPLGEQTHS